VCVGMPILSGQKKSGSEMSPKHVQGAGPGVKKNTATPPLPAPPSPAAGGPRSAPTGGRRVIPPRQELIFHCQLAHGSPTKEIKDFTNVKELYARIAAAFGISPDQVCPYLSPTHTYVLLVLLHPETSFGAFTCMQTCVATVFSFPWQHLVVHPPNNCTA
jgi:hypothetical protein